MRKTFLVSEVSRKTKAVCVKHKVLPLLRCGKAVEHVIKAVY